MISRTLVLDAIAHHTCDRIPSTLYLDDPIWRRLEQLHPHTAALAKKQNDTIRILWDINSQKVDDNSFIDPFGVRWIRSHASYQFVDPPLSRPDIKQIPEIPLLTEDDVEKIRTIRRHNHDKFIYYQFTMTFGERLWALRGLEQYLVDLVERPRFVHEALDLLLEMHLKALEVLVTLPIDGVTFGDDFGSQKGMMISPDMFRRFYKARLGKMYEYVRSAGLIAGAHSCGDNTPIFRDFVEIGLQLFHPLQPECMDIQAIKAEFGKDLAFRGGIGVQRGVAHGSPGDVRQEVFNAVEILSEGGGYLLEPVKPLSQETPIENVVAFVEAVNDAQQYQFV